MNFTWLLAVVAFTGAIIFYGWHIQHGVWQWEFLMMWGLLLWCLSGHPKAP